MKKYTYRRVKKAGKIHARDWKWDLWPFMKSPKDPQPKMDQKIPTEYEKELKEAGGTEIQKLSSRWESLDHKLKPRYAQLQAKIRNLKALFRVKNDEVCASKNKHDEALRKLNKLPSPDLSKFWMNFWLVIIGVAEIPLNGLVFQLFGEGKLLTYLMAGMLCVGIPLVAHWIGQTLHQDSNTKIDWLILSAISIMLFALLFVVGLVRAKYLATLLTQVPIGINIHPSTATIIFFILNFSFFVIACIVSYSGSHPQHTIYNTRLNRVRDCFSILGKLNHKVNTISHDLSEAQEELAKERFEREKKWKWYHSKANEFKDLVRFYIASYRKANMEERISAAVPECFNNSPSESFIPFSLQELDWDFESGSHENKEEI